MDGGLTGAAERFVTRVGAELRRTAADIAPVATDSDAGGDGGAPA